MAETPLEHHQAAAPVSAPAGPAVLLGLIEGPEDILNQSMPVSPYTLRIVSSFQEAEPAWRALEADCMMTGYQGFDWLSAWQQHVGAAHDIEPLICLAEKDGRTVALLPLGVHRSGALRVARWLGGKLNNYNFGLWDRAEFAAGDGAALQALLRDIAREANIDTVELANMPRAWQGIPSPFLSLQHLDSPSGSFVLQLSDDFDALFAARRSSKARRQQRRKLNRILEEGTVEVIHGGSRAQALAAVDANIEQRNHRAHVAGVPSVYADPGVADLMRDIVGSSTDSETPAFEAHAFSVDGVIRSTYIATVRNGRMSCALNSISDDDLTHLSPGDLLLSDVIRNACERGLSEIDLGIGEMAYKTAWCEPEPLIDCILPVTPKGKLVAALHALQQKAKRAVKGNALLWNGYLRLRKLRARLR